jgi:hypothetical protein
LFIDRLARIPPARSASRMEITGGLAPRSALKEVVVVLQPLIDHLQDKNEPFGGNHDSRWSQRTAD